MFSWDIVEFQSDRNFKGVTFWKIIESFIIFWLSVICIFFLGLRLRKIKCSMDQVFLLILLRCILSYLKVWTVLVFWNGYIFIYCYLFIIIFPYCSQLLLSPFKMILQLILSNLKFWKRRFIILFKAQFCWIFWNGIQLF